MTPRFESVGHGSPLTVIVAFVRQFHMLKAAAKFIEHGNVRVNEDVELAPEKTVRPGDKLKIEGVRQEIIAIK